MEYSDVVRRRRMVRAYDPERPVPRDALLRMLDLAVRAPSAGFSQGWDFLVLTAPADRDLFWQVTSDPDAEPDAWLTGMRSAPALVLCLSDPNRYLDRYAEPDKGWADRDVARWPVPYWDVDTGMAALLVLLSAVDEGLAGCFFGVPPEHQAATLAAFGAPPDRRVVGVCSLGYAAADRRSPSLRRGRRPVAEVAHDGRYAVPFV
ncbi:nitroreductase family protein [Kineosporia sp. A_224]|uniref:nitroreductase family protein n=1 Tax=Kineosporia sp. A_224 TaxID=1962180 RepID=UPI000B4BFD21|nr:nitroreductase family protein [Kineosporia sp. A_224]